MTNLLQTIIDELQMYDKTIADIKWIGCRDYIIDKADFLDIASQHTFILDLPANLVPEDLIIAGEDWWLERFHSEQRENWVFKQYPTRPQIKGRCTIIPIGPDQDEFIIEGY